MRSLVILTLAIVALGCGKKTVKFTGKAGDSAAVTPQPAGGPANNGDPKKPGGEKPNWLTDPRAKSDKEGDQLPVESQPGKPGFGEAKLPSGPATQPGAPTGVLQPQPVAPAKPPATTTTPPKLGGKPVSEADMKEVWIFIENASLASGKMPPPELVYAALVKADAKAAELVKDGSIWLTGATARESVWAFEVKAVAEGGLIASQNGVENVTAAELKRRLGR
jgi:hypothetical protein